MSDASDLATIHPLTSEPRCDVCGRDLYSAGTCLGCSRKKNDDAKAAERARADSLAAERDAAIRRAETAEGDLAAWKLQCEAQTEIQSKHRANLAALDQAAENLQDAILADLTAQRDSLTASIVKACEGTGCVNAHELAEALRDARAKLAVTEADVKHYQDMLRVSEEALRQARADRDVLAAMCRVHLESTPAKHGWVTRVVSAKNAVLASGALSRANGGVE